MKGELLVWGVLCAIVLLSCVDEEIDNIKLEEQVVAAQVIAVAYLDIPIEEIRTSIKQKNYNYFNIDITYFENIKNSARDESLPLRYFSRPTNNTIKFSRLKRLNKKKVIIFMLDYLDSEYYPAMFLSGDDNYAILEYDYDLYNDLIREIHEQNAIVENYLNSHDTNEDSDDVKQIINEFFDEKRASQAYAQLLNLGIDAVPSIIDNMNDYRELAVKQITVENKSKYAFEKYAHYGPELVIDVLSLILSRITGRHFNSLYSGDLSNFHRIHEFHCWIIWKEKLYDNYQK